MAAITARQVQQGERPLLLATAERRHQGLAELVERRCHHRPADREADQQLIQAGRARQARAATAAAAAEVQRQRRTEQTQVAQHRERGKETAELARQVATARRAMHRAAAAAEQERAAAMLAELALAERFG